MNNDHEAHQLLMDTSALVAILNRLDRLKVVLIGSVFPSSLFVFFGLALFSGRADDVAVLQLAGCIAVALGAMIPLVIIAIGACILATPLTQAEIRGLHSFLWNEAGRSRLALVTPSTNLRAMHAALIHRAHERQLRRETLTQLAKNPS